MSRDVTVWSRVDGNWSSCLDVFFGWLFIVVPNVPLEFAHKAPGVVSLFKRFEKDSTGLFEVFFERANPLKPEDL